MNCNQNPLLLAFYLTMIVHYQLKLNDHASIKPYPTPNRGPAFSNLNTGIPPAIIRDRLQLEAGLLLEVDKYGPFGVIYSKFEPTSLLGIFNCGQLFG